MKNHFKYLLICFVCGFFISCDKTEEIAFKSGDCFIKSISYFENSPDTEYDFDSEGRLLAARQLGALDGRLIATKKYTYKPNGKVETCTYNGILITTYFYENELLTRTETKNNSGAITATQLIQQNPTSKLIEKLINKDYLGEITHNFSYDAEGNCTKIEGFNKDGKPLYVSTYSGFVNGKNAFATFKGLPFRPFEFIIGEIPVLGAPVNFGKASKYQTESKILETANQGINNPSDLIERFNTKWEYKFNGNGYPTISTSYDITGGKAPSLNGERNYVYSKCD
jgi:hypothetical protein